MRASRFGGLGFGVSVWAVFKEMCRAKTSFKKHLTLGVVDVFSTKGKEFTTGQSTTGHQRRS